MKKILLGTMATLAVATALNAEDCIMVKELNVEFKNASTVYANSSEYAEVKEFANFLKQTGLYAVIEGHTSSLANAKYNYNLSNSRAAKVRQTLVNLGVNPAQVKYMGFGESSPLYDNNTETGAAKNRRVRAEVFNMASELNSYIATERKRVEPIKYTEQ